MGSGKSTLGRALATAKNISFVDLDAYIAEREKCSVPDIFKIKERFISARKKRFTCKKSSKKKRIWYFL